MRARNLDLGLICVLIVSAAVLVALAIHGRQLNPSASATPARDLEELAPRPATREPIAVAQIVERAQNDSDQTPNLDALRRSLSDPRAEVRSAAVRGLAQLANEAAIETLGTVLSGEDGHLRLQALDALGNIPGAASERWLRRAADDSDPVLSAAATEWLAERTPPVKNSR